MNEAPPAPRHRKKPASGKGRTPPAQSISTDIAAPFHVDSPAVPFRPAFSSSELHLFARLADAAYLHDAGETVQSLDMEHIGQIGNTGCQALIAKWRGNVVVAFQGTRVLENSISIPELWDDLNGIACHLSDGTIVHGGFWLPLVDLWPRVKELLPDGGGRIIVGHSLGGVRAHLAKALCPEAEIVSYGAPKGAGDAFWAKHYADAPPTRLVHERDFAPVWPYEDRYVHPPGKFGWMHNGLIIEAVQRPGLCVSIADHSITHGYTPFLARFAEVALPHHRGAHHTEFETLLRAALAEEYAITSPYRDDPHRTAYGTNKARRDVDLLIRAVHRAGLGLHVQDGVDLQRMLAETRVP